MGFLDTERIYFDANGNTSISKEKLLMLLKKSQKIEVFFELEKYPSECYLLVDRNLIDAYPFPITELAEWETDGSCEQGDLLYKMELTKRY